MKRLRAGGHRRRPPGPHPRQAAGARCPTSNWWASSIPCRGARDKVAADCGTHWHLPTIASCSAAVDAAVIATPTRFHHGVALDFLKIGTPLLVEKPLAADLARGR